MQSIIERIEKGQLWKFHGGIHPPEQKFLTNSKPIKKSTIPELLIIPIQQHIGVPADIIVAVGDSVLKGQPLTQTSMPMMVPIHAPTSGEIVKIEEHIIAHPSGLRELCIFIKPDGADTWRSKNICSDYTQLTHDEIVERIANAGISGMGGAGFPTHIKVNTKAKIEFLIINAAECEPYITADDLLIREHSAKIVDGIKILQQLLSPTHVVIGIEDNKPEAIATLKQVTQGSPNITVCPLPTKYPTGGEKQLIQVLTGKEVTSGTLPSSLGIVMQNIATCFAIAEAVIDDIPLIRRVVTVTGKALAKPQNIWALIGTPVGYLLDQFGYNPDSQDKRIIMGGPMMGFTLPSDTVPIVKFTNCILTPSKEEISMEQNEVECIRCGQCAEVCPSQLLPQELQWSAKANDHEQLKKLNLFDCIDCGACAYVCPSHIPLVHYYRIAKADIRQKQLLDIKAEKAKTRFEARKARLERDKKEREEKQRLASEARKAAMNAKTEGGESAKSAVAAALARVKAKKAQQQVPAADSDDKKSQVSAAIERAKAKKAASAKTNVDVNASISTEDSQANIKSSKSAAVAAAVAKAKAKKEAQMGINDKSPDIDATPSKEVRDDSASKSNADDKKAKVAAAVAKAKAKKQAQKTTDSSDVNTDLVASSITPEPQSDADIKQAKISAAITKAKEKKSNNAPNESSDDSKKARVSAAVAKAKAKKLAKDAATEQATEQITNKHPVSDEEHLDEPQEQTKAAKISAVIEKAKLKKERQSATSSESNADDEEKKKRIAAAVAKAKAKKQQQTESN